MSLIYLAGEDSATEEGERLPVHKSRFWAYAGADIQRFEQITHLVALQWSFTWHCPEEAQQDVAMTGALLASRRLGMQAGSLSMSHMHTYSHEGAMTCYVLFTIVRSSNTF